MTTEVAVSALCTLLRSHVTSCILRKSIRSTTQIWIVTDYQYGISAAIPEMSFLYETSTVVVLQNVCCFFRLDIALSLLMLNLPWTPKYCDKIDNVSIGVILGVKTCEILLSFLAIIIFDSIVLNSRWLLCINCFTSLVSFTGFSACKESTVQ